VVDGEESTARRPPPSRSGPGQHRPPSPVVPRRSETPTVPRTAVPRPSRHGRCSPGGPCPPDRRPTLGPLRAMSPAMSAVGSTKGSTKGSVKGSVLGWSPRHRPNRHVRRPKRAPPRRRTQGGRWSESLEDVRPRAGPHCVIEQSIGACGAVRASNDSPIQIKHGAVRLARIGDWSSWLAGPRCAGPRCGRPSHRTGPSPMSSA